MLKKKKTDGVSNRGAEQTIPAARLAHEDGIHINTIGIGLTDYHELNGIASPPASVNSFKVADFDELQNVDEMIFASTCPSKESNDSLCCSQKLLISCYL